MARFRFSHRAEADLFNIGLYTSNWSVILAQVNRRVESEKFRPSDPFSFPNVTYDFSRFVEVKRTTGSLDRFRPFATQTPI